MKDVLLALLIGCSVLTFVDWYVTKENAIVEFCEEWIKKDLIEQFTYIGVSDACANKVLKFRVMKKGTNPSPQK